jgi:hypothetical protein
MDAITRTIEIELGNKSVEITRDDSTATDWTGGRHRRRYYNDIDSWGDGWKMFLDLSGSARINTGDIAVVTDAGTIVVQAGPEVNSARKRDNLVQCIRELFAD